MEKFVLEGNGKKTIKIDDNTFYIHWMQDIVRNKDIDAGIIKVDVSNPKNPIITYICGKKGCWGTTPTANHRSLTTHSENGELSIEIENRILYKYYFLVSYDNYIFEL